MEKRHGLFLWVKIKKKLQKIFKKLKKMTIIVKSD